MDTAHADTPTRRGRPGHDREAVLDAAVALFNERGYDATSVADVAGRLGVTKSALYHHFSSKEAVLELALGRALDSLEAALDQPRDGRRASAALRDVFRGATDALVTNLPYVTLLLRVRGNGPVEQAALARRRTFDQRVTALVAQAQSDGDIRDDVDASVVARLIFGMINSLVEWYRPGGAIDGSRLGHDVVTLALDGLLPTGGPRTQE